MRATLRAAALCSVALLSAIGCGPRQPSGGGLVTLTSVRYVRTRPVVAPEATVFLQYSILHLNDPYQRRQMGAFQLRAIDEVTFVYDHANTFSVPFDQWCSFYVNDTSVSPYSVATDIYVNDTKVKVEKAGNFETARFRVDQNGRVY